MTPTATPYRIVSCTSASPPDPFQTKLQELANLPDGWRFGKGIAPQPQTLRVARLIYRAAFPLPLKADAFPGADGSLTVVFYADSRCVEIVISPDETIDITVEDGYGHDVEEIREIPKASILETITEVYLLAKQASEIWYLSDYCTHENTIKIQDDSGALASIIPVMGLEFHWSISTVLPNASRPVGSISISSSTTPALLVSR
jgi:hypothetical protein